MGRRCHMVGFHHQRLLQLRSSWTACTAILAGQCRDLCDDLHRDCLSLPDLAAAHAALSAGSGHLPPRPVRRLLGLILLLLRHDHGAHELPASGMADASWRMVEAQDRRHGDDLRRPLRLLRAVDGVAFGVRRAAGRSGSATSAPILPPSSATRNWRRRSISSCPTAGRCRASRRIATSSCAYRDCGGRSRSSTCRC